MSDEPTKKPTTKFGSVQQQRETVDFSTIGGRKEESDMQSTITSKRQDIITSKQQAATEMKRQTVYMPKHLATRLKIHAAATDKDISGIITELVESYLEREEGK